MTDDTTRPEEQAPVESAVDEPVAESADSNAEVVVPLPQIAAQEAKTVGDENLSPREPEFEINADEVPAQVMGKPDAPVSVVPVHETFVATDRIITDTSDPLAVQIPDAGRGDASLPAHRLAGPTVEQYFAENASEPNSDSDDS